MDPVAHTLFGATLAETGLRRKTALATATLVVGANLPDVDAITMVAGSDTSLLLRRGWTHGILAMIVWPFLLTGLMLFWYRFRHGSRRSRKNGSGENSFRAETSGNLSGSPAMHPGWLFAIACIAVWSHPFLDWLNTYGVRLLMPFDDRWFYGDTLFIIDPWMWLLTGSAVVLARSRHPLSASGWILLGSGATALILLTPHVPTVAKWVWGAGVILIVWLRLGPRRLSIQSERVACSALGLFGLYLFWMMAATHFTAREVERLAESEGYEVSNIMVEPLPARPFLRQGILETESEYLFFSHRFPGDESHELHQRRPPITKVEPDRVIRSALEAESVQGLVVWMRFPHYEVIEWKEGWKVTIRDLRFAPPEAQRESGFGKAEVWLDRDLNPVGK